jgi:hypothetical protein
VNRLAAGKGSAPSSEGEGVVAGEGLPHHRAGRRALQERRGRHNRLLPGSRSGVQRPPQESRLRSREKLAP